MRGVVANCTLRRIGSRSACGKTSSTAAELLFFIISQYASAWVNHVTPYLRFQGFEESQARLAIDGVDKLSLCGGQWRLLWAKDEAVLVRDTHSCRMSARLLY